MKDRLFFCQNLALTFSQFSPALKMVPSFKVQIGKFTAKAAGETSIFSLKLTPKNRPSFSAGKPAVPTPGKSLQMNIEHQGRYEEKSILKLTNLQVTTGKCRFNQLNRPRCPNDTGFVSPWACGSGRTGRESMQGSKMLMPG